MLEDDQKRHREEREALPVGATKMPQSAVKGPATRVVKEFIESEVRVESEIYRIHCKGAAGETKRGSAQGGKKPGFFMVPSGHPWVNVPSIWWLGLGMSSNVDNLGSLLGMPTAFFFCCFILVWVFIYLFIYLMAALGLRCCVQAFSSCSKRGASLCCGARASHCGGSSCCRARALGAGASVVMACRL